jgi:hypothetical protein
MTQLEIAELDTHNSFQIGGQSGGFLYVAPSGGSGPMYDQQMSAKGVRRQGDGVS